MTGRCQGKRILVLWVHMDDCLFCKLVNGEIPAHKIYEDEMFIAFLDIFPKSKGHTLVIPKKHYRWVYDVPEFGLYWETALKVTKTLQKALKPEYISYVTYGIQVPHAHIHIIPRYSKDEKMPDSTKGDHKELAETVFLIKKEV